MVLHVDQEHVIQRTDRRCGRGGQHRGGGQGCADGERQVVGVRVVVGAPRPVGVLEQHGDACAAGARRDRPAGVAFEQLGLKPALQYRDGPDFACAQWKLARGQELDGRGRLGQFQPVAAEPAAQRVGHGPAVDGPGRAAEVDDLGNGGRRHVSAAEVLHAAVRRPVLGGRERQELRMVGPGDPSGEGSRTRVLYLITVGVPVAVQPGIVTPLYPDNDGSPTSAPGLTNRFGLIVAAAVALGAVSVDSTSRPTPMAAPATRQRRQNIQVSPLCLEIPRIAPSIVRYATRGAYAVARIDTQQLPFGDRVGEVMSLKSCTGCAL